MQIFKKKTTLSMLAVSVAIIILLLVFISANYRFLYGDMNESLYIRLSLFSFVLIVFFAVLSFVRNDTRVNALMTAFSLMGGVYIMEILLHFSYFGQIKAQSKESIPSYDYRTYDEVVDYFQRDSIDAVPRIAPMSFLDTEGIVGKARFNPVMPLSGVSNIKTVLCNESGQYALYESDRYGFNNNNKVWDSSNSKWALVGDSFTHGSCVSPEDNIAGGLTSGVNHTIVNLGYSGDGPLLELATLVEYASALKPEKVFWIYCEGNDLTDLKKELKNSTLTQYMQESFSQGLINRQKEIDRSLLSYLDLSRIINNNKVSGKDKVKLVGVDHIKRILRLYNLREKLGLVNYFSEVPDEFQSILSKADQVVSSWGGELYFVYLPAYLRYSSLVEDHDEYNHKGQILKMVESTDIPVIDIHERVFAEHEDALGLFPYRINGHYTPEGYRLTSESILNFIKDSKNTRH